MSAASITTLILAIILSSIVIAYRYRTFKLNFIYLIFIVGACEVVGKAERVFNVLFLFRHS